MGVALLLIHFERTLFMTHFYSVYALTFPTSADTARDCDPDYVGITTKDPEQRLREHVIQAVKNFQTRKDKAIYTSLTSGHFPVVQTLFTSVWSDEQVALQIANNPRYSEQDALRALAGQDEEAVCLYFRDIVGLTLMNIAAGDKKTTLSRAIVVSETSGEFKRWLNARNPNCKPLLLAKSQVRTKAKNSVTYDDQETVMVITPVEMARIDHDLCGPNTLSISYRWDSSNQDAPGFVHGKSPEPRSGKRSKPFIDTYKACSDMQVGTSYRIFTEKWLAPDDPETTKCWSWSAHEEFNFETVKKSLEDRLLRIKQLPHQLQDWEEMVNLEASTRSVLRHLIETNSEREGKPFTTQMLLNFLHA